MHARTLAALAALGLTSLTPLPAAAQAVTFNLENIGPITPGATVSLSAYFSQALLDSAELVGSEPEPPPEPGTTQTWVKSDSLFRYESLQDISFTLTPPSGTPTVGTPLVGPADPGNVYVTNWFFALSFDQPGTYTVSLDTAWTTRLDSTYVTEVAYRSCDFNADCSDWNDQTELYSFTELNNFSDGPLMLQVQVVPEPATTALWLLGLGAMGTLLQRRHRAAAVA